MARRRLSLSILTLISLFCVFCKNSGKGSASSGSNKSDEVPDSAVRPTGLIAYIRNGTEIRLIDSNGQHDRLFWTDKDINEAIGVHSLAWRPDGKELAFSSGHEILYSLYDADIYCIRPDGSGLRRITNAPAKKEFAKYKKGVVSVTFHNTQSIFEEAKASRGVFFVTMAGAEDPQMLTLTPGSSRTITFKSVADFGEDVQPIVVMSGSYRWFMPGIDVQSGRSQKAPDFNIQGNGTEYFGAYDPDWKQDGSTISFRNGLCMLQTISSHPPDGVPQYNPMFSGDNPLGTCTWDYGSTPALSDVILYTANGDDGSSVYRMKEGSVHDPSSRVVQFSDLQQQVLHDLKWLPDGSGFLYSSVSLVSNASNLFRYDLRTGQTTQLTQFDNAFVRRFCISPSGRWIIYERALTDDGDKDIDLWIMKIDGSAGRIFVKNGWCPSWSR